jgi:hypothetical protein
MRIVAIAQDPIEVPRLPEPSLKPWLRGVCRPSFRVRNEHPEIGSRRCSFDQQMQMIWHEAVRKKFEVVSACGFHELQPNEIDKGFAREALAARKRAQRQEIDRTALV